MSFVTEHVYVDEDDNNNSTQLAHLVLYGISAHTLGNISFVDDPHLFGLSAFIFGHGLFGILRFTNTFPRFLPEITKIHKISNYFASNAPLSFVYSKIVFPSMDIVHDKDQSKFLIENISTLFLNSCSKFSSSRYLRYLSNYMILLNAGGLVCMGIKNENDCAALLGALSIFNHFLGQKLAQYFNINNQNVSTYGLTLSMVLARMCLKD